MIFLPNTVTREQITENYRKIQKQHENLMLESERTKKLVKEAVVIVQSEALQLNNMSSPSKVSKLNPDMVKYQTSIVGTTSFLKGG